MSWLTSPHAAWLTHGSAIVMTVALFVMLLVWPFWLAVVPAVILTHRIGVMMHEYIDGLTMMFGLLELFRATHLSHHRWLNSPGDSGFDNLHVKEHPSKVMGTIAALEVTQHLKFYWEALHGLHPYARRRRILLGVATSSASIVFWVAVGRADIIWKLMLLTTFTTAVPVSLRGAIEHHTEPGRGGFANEYRVLIPLFNLNRHIHHHEDPRLPWYRLQWRTPSPLHWRHYFLYWFRVYVRKDLVLMHPMQKGSKPTDFPT